MKRLAVGAILVLATTVWAQGQAPSGGAGATPKSRSQVAGSAEGSSEFRALSTQRTGARPLVSLTARLAPATQVLDWMAEAAPGERLLVALPALKRLEGVKVSATISQVPWDSTLEQLARQMGLTVTEQQGTSVLSLDKSRGTGTAGTAGAGGSVTFRDSQTEVRVDRGTGRMSISARNAPLSQILELLARADRGVSFIVDDATASQVPPITAQLRDVTIEEALQAIMRQSHLRARKTSNVYTITPQP